MAVKKYNLRVDGEKNISTHFKVKEFRSYSSKYKKLYSQDVLVSDELVTKLEMLRAKLNCSITIINGYRSKLHNQAVGGSANSTHLKGYAADICCYDSNKQTISGKIVCCAAQILGFKGIGYMTSNHVHVDMSPSRIWFGDETRRQNGVYYSLTKNKTDFFKYFNLTESCFDKYKKVGEIKPSNWAVTAWNRAISEKITDGTAPTRPLKRNEALTMCARYFYKFNYTLNDAVKMACDAGFTDGTNLDRYITKEQAATFIVRFLKKNGAITITEATEYAKEKEIIIGDNTGSYNLLKECTRQEFIVMLYRVKK